MKELILDNLEVGERIRSIRKDLKMNREKFSEMIDISDVFLGQIERGERSLSLKTLCKIVSFTGASTDFILFGTNTNNSTIHKINRILSKSSDANIEYFYKIINCSHTFFKTYKEDD
ncbi:MAG: helix-turn-helix transcriptional regulator [Clostridia bacterium]|nr:helix-turn-helix transcriptional regulator [Clostridia bacterium]